MAQYIDKSALVAEIERLREEEYPCDTFEESTGYYNAIDEIATFVDTLEVKKVDLIINTIIAECCDWLVMNTNLSHDEIEGCRNLMLTVKEKKQLKAQKGE